MPFSLNRRPSAPGSDSSGVEFSPLTNKTPRESRQTLESSGEDETVPDAKPLRRSWPGLAFDGAITLLPLAFVGLLIAAASHDQKPESTSGNRIQQALILSPTIFPIVFAAICGKAMKSFALYRSQEGGASIRLLEQLVGASSVFSALERVVVLRNFGAIGLATALIWLLSPLGGQALSSRLLVKHNFYSNTTQNATYLGSTFLNVTYMGSDRLAQLYIPTVSAMYLTSLSSSESIRGSPRDAWGNPKTSIPYAWAGDGDWKEVADPTNTSTYTNLIGVPVDAFSDGTVSESVLSSLNMETRCSPLERTRSQNLEQSLEGPLLVNTGGGGTYPNGTTRIVFQQGFASGKARNFLYVTNASWAQFEADVARPITILYGSFMSNDGLLGTLISVATCHLVLRRLETKLGCDGQTCRVAAARKRPPAIDAGGIAALKTLLTTGYFAGLGPSNGFLGKSQTDNFITTGSIASDGVYLDEIPLSLFEERFTQVFNTYWYAATARQAIVEYPGNGPYVDLVRTPATVRTDLGPHYTCHWVWFGLGLAIVLLLEAISIANVLLRLRTRVPDVFGFVSSMAIGNKYCEDKGLVRSSALDGLERARALGHVRFQLADVRGTEEVGRIAFVPRVPGEDLTDGDQGNIGLSSVEWNRYYD